MDEQFHVIRPADLLGGLNAVERKYAPEQLYLRGDRTLLQLGPRVAVVGSRAASQDSLKRTRALTSKLVSSGVVVVSGLAEGIDTAAHNSALELGGRTIAVLGTPLDVAFPKSNQALQERIGREHLLVSQFEVGRPVHQSNFPVRNRTMALLSDATIIVDAGPRSGTEHQGWEALRLGRLLLIAETLAQRTDLEWVKKMQQYGAQVLSRSNFDEFIVCLPERTRGDVVAL